eukprot:COSAG05_NODE_48_length_24425_cov_90.438543_18_plen_219_part_00
MRALRIIFKRTRTRALGIAAAAATAAATAAVYNTGPSASMCAGIPSSSTRNSSFCCCCASHEQRDLLSGSSWTSSKSRSSSRVPVSRKRSEYWEFLSSASTATRPIHSRFRCSRSTLTVYVGVAWRGLVGVCAGRRLGTAPARTGGISGPPRSLSRNEADTGIPTPSISTALCIVLSAECIKHRNSHRALAVYIDAMNTEAGRRAVVFSVYTAVLLPV